MLTSSAFFTNTHTHTHVCVCVCVCLCAAKGRVCECVVETKLLALLPALLPDLLPRTLLPSTAARLWRRCVLAVSLIFDVRSCFRDVEVVFKVGAQIEFYSQRRKNLSFTYEQKKMPS